MNGLKYNVVLRAVKALDAGMMLIPFALCWYLYYGHRLASPYFRRGNYLILVLYLILYVLYGRIYDGFKVSFARISEMIYSQTLAAGISDAILYIIIWLLSKRLPNVLPLLAALCGQIAAAGLWCVCAHRWYFRTFPPHRAAVIYDERASLSGLIGEYGLDRKFDVQRKLLADDCVKNLSALDGFDTVFLSGVHSHDRNVILKYCIANGISVYAIPRLGDTIMSGAKAVHLFHLPMLQVGRYNPAPEYLFLKRTFDIVASGAALLVLSPVMIATAIAIRATDGGPVFYRQTRLTKDGRPFALLKFRSMRVDAEKDGVARLSSGAQDDRVTNVGRFIRRVRIDEIPQFFCILAGSMTICGPRPERPEIARQYTEEMPEFALRLQAKAGLTGYAQVYGKYNSTPYDKLQMDLMYIAHPSIMEDLKIIFATVKILFVPESTEGIAPGQTTALEELPGAESGEVRV
jgi:lipopolysaccharide/colanic/teichoic acid biosynthesis glycosyltransferase